MQVTSALRPGWLLLIAVGLFLLGCRQSAPLDTSVTPVGRDIPKLIQKLSAEGSTSRASACRYLGRLGAEGELGAEQDQILAKLKELAQNDPSEQVKKDAAAAIQAIEGG